MAVRENSGSGTRRLGPEDRCVAAAPKDVQPFGEGERSRPRGPAKAAVHQCEKLHAIKHDVRPISRTGTVGQNARGIQGSSQERRAEFGRGEPQDGLHTRDENGEGGEAYGEAGQSGPEEIIQE